MSEPEMPEARSPGLRLCGLPVVHALYAAVLLGASMATFGVSSGAITGGAVVVFWAIVFYNWSRPRGLGIAIAALVLLVCIVSLLMPPLNYAREAARRSSCKNNLKQLSLALWHYHDVYDTFPPAYVVDETGRPMHSWRVLLLPYLDQTPLYEDYDFDEPWDGPHNQRLLERPTPPEFICPSESRSHSERGLTRYVAVVGPRTAWPGAKGRREDEFIDGTWRTLMVLESGSRHVPWMAPRDLTLDEAVSTLTSIDPETGCHVDDNWFFSEKPGANAAFAHGRIDFVSSGLDRALAAELLTIDDGGPSGDVDSNGWAGKQTLSRPIWKWGNITRLAIFVVLLLLPLPWVWWHPSGTAEKPADEDESVA